MEITTRTLIIMIILIILAAVVILLTLTYSKNSQSIMGTTENIFPKLWEW